VSEIRIVGRNTQGVRIMNLREGDKISSVARVEREEEETGEPTNGQAPTPEIGSEPETT
jgi:DNA gyrase subunit A